MHASFAYLHSNETLNFNMAAVVATEKKALL